MYLIQFIFILYFVIQLYILFVLLILETDLILQITPLVNESKDNKNKYKHTYNIINSVYYSFVTQCTIGYGDIYPIKWWSKLIVITQLILILTLVFNV